MQGIAVASGSSCLSQARQISHVLAAIGLDPALARANLLHVPGPRQHRGRH